MKKIALYIVSLLPFIISAQQSGNITIKWNNKTELSYGDYKVTVPQFDTDSYNFDNYNKELKFVIKLQTSSFVDEQSIIITNIVYEPIDESLLGELNKQKIPTSINVKITNCIAREDIKAALVLSPIIKEGNNYKKVMSFSYSFNLGANVNRSNNVSAISNSVLSTGTWKRFYVTTSGVYKLSKSFLRGLGVNVDVDPRKIKIYGNGGRMLPLKNSVYYPDDLAENAIQVIGEADGSFNDDDYVLFYAEGVDNWSQENNTNNNLYADKSYYYVNTEGQDGKRIANFVEPTAASTVSVSQYTGFQYHEVDLTNMVRLGRVWFGESFNLNNEQDFTFNFSNVDTTQPTQLKVHVGDDTYVNTNFKISANGTAVATINQDHIGGSSINQYVQNTLNTSITSSQNYDIKVIYNNGGVPTSKGYLDYIILQPICNLTGFGKQYRFSYTNNSASAITQFQFSNSSSLKHIWDITDIYNVTTIENNNQSNFSFKSNISSNETRKYIAIDEADLYEPLKDSNTSVSNQNLKGTIFLDSYGAFQDIDYLIVTPNFLHNQAEKLAAFHRSYSGLNVKVVDLDVIYQEFSGGKQDIGGIRNFVKYVYKNASTPSARVKYLNLFGDASFDFKNRIPNNTNIVPIFQALNSYTLGESSFASDDYFCLMDNNEGDPENGIYNVDIANGRMIVSTTQQADEMVNKVFEYYDIKSYGNWRNNYVAISDDIDKPTDATLEVRQNNLTDILYAQKPFLNFKKILLDGYVQQTSAGGARYPQAKADIFNGFEKGALVFNYLGHGGEVGLTGERIWDKFDGSNLFNQYKYPLFITITCDFSRFDNPYNPTAGEYTYWNPKGGAISMVTTIRTIGQTPAENFNDTFASTLFSYGSNVYYSIAESLRQAKNASNNNSATEVVFCIGDPALKLAIPEPKVVLTKVNDVPITQPVDDLKALSYVKLSGQVQDENGNLLNSYNGELFVNVFDKNYASSTYNNDNEGSIISYINLGETIFRGNASVTNGQFEFGFIVPKDIKIPVGNGRISFYAKQNQILHDKTGYNLDIKVGGINLNAVADVTPPKVRLYMNDETFVNGGITNQSPYFLAFLYDEHGINTASGIGHDIVAILDGDVNNPYILNDYYETALNDYTNGKIRFPLRNLALGLHTITFKAWDVYNNYVTAEIQFVVVGDDDVTLTNVLNYPNPFVNYTQFWFTHNKPYEQLEVQVQIITITGKVVKTINQYVTTEGFLSRNISWDGKDDFGDKIGKGVYVYKLTVKSLLTNKKSEKIEKLVIL